MKICSIDDCNNKHDCHSFCAKHAQRFRRYGDPLYITPKEIQYQNNRKAQLKRSKIKPATYKKFHGRHEHRVIAEIKIGRRLERGEIVHHIDGDKHNNSIENLEVMTQSQHINEHRLIGTL